MTNWPRFFHLPITWVNSLFRGKSFIVWMNIWCLVHIMGPLWKNVLKYLTLTTCICMSYMFACSRFYKGNYYYCRSPISKLIITVYYSRKLKTAVKDLEFPFVFESPKRLNFQKNKPNEIFGINNYLQHFFFEKLSWKNICVLLNVNFFFVSSVTNKTDKNYKNFCSILMAPCLYIVHSMFTYTNEMKCTRTLIPTLMQGLLFQKWNSFQTIKNFGHLLLYFSTKMSTNH